jgi:hypothetical protein
LVRFPVVCPVCGGREELEARTPDEVLALLSCAIPECPRCGWAREEDGTSPVWGVYGEVYHAHLEGREVRQSLLDELGMGLEGP